jgi:hypothetical protein
VAERRYPAYLYRFSYDPIFHRYSLDSGFPVQINDYKTESLVIAKDSTGVLWATWMQGNGIYVWAWNFGDGGTSTAQHPTHTYVVPGSYIVSLEATNSAGSDIETKLGYVTVTGSGGGGGVLLYSFGLQSNSATEAHYSSSRGSKPPELVLTP